MKQKIYRQGDVMLVKINGIEKEKCAKAKPINGRIILAHGEVTGHHHSIDSDSADWWKNGDDQFVELHNPTQLIHQEHSPIDLPVGIYRVIRQREYTPEAIRNVAD